jgi:hypothetical protein
MEEETKKEEIIELSDEELGCVAGGAVKGQCPCPRHSPAPDS